MKLWVTLIIQWCTAQHRDSIALHNVLPYVGGFQPRIYFDLWREVYFKLLTTLKRNVTASRSWAIQRAFYFSLFQTGLFQESHKKDAKKSNKMYLIWFRECRGFAPFFLPRLYAFLFVDAIGKANLITQVCRKPRFVKRHWSMSSLATV